MKVSELAKDTLIVTAAPDGFERVYLVDHVGREVISVTIVAARRPGMPRWTAVAGLEQQISLNESGFFVLAGPAIGGLVRAQAWALADAHPTVAALPKRPARNTANAMVVDGSAKPPVRNYDADSNLPLGWVWGEAEWPGCERVLPTAVGPDGERFAKHKGRTFKAGFLAGKELLMPILEMAYDAMVAAQAGSVSVRFDADPRKTFGLNWISTLSNTTDAQACMAEQSIAAIAREAKESKTYELTGWRFGRYPGGRWFGGSRGLTIVRADDGSCMLSGPDDWDWEQRIMPILDRLATDPALNE